MENCLWGNFIITIMSYVTAKGHKTWKLGICSNYYRYYQGLHSYFKSIFLYERSAWNLPEYKEHAKNMPEPVRKGLGYYVVLWYKLS